MFTHQPLRDLDDYFTGLRQRNGATVFFYRITGYNERIQAFIQKYYESARSSGIIIEGNLANPDGKQLAYYQEIMGTNFQLSVGFLTSSLHLWLPRMSPTQCKDIATALYDALASLQRAGKNANMLKNAYIKLMCWLYYRFERVMNRVGEEAIPKILYEGTVRLYELLLLSVLSRAGCDIVLLQYDGGISYQAVDPDSRESIALKLPNMGSFPAGFSLKSMRQQMQIDLQNERLYGPPPSSVRCTNAWMSGEVDVFHNLCKNVEERRQSYSNDNRFFFNAFCRVIGVTEPLTYAQELYKLQQVIRSQRRPLVIIEQRLPPPTNEELQSIRRSNTYPDSTRMLQELSGNIRYTASEELQRLMRKAFLDTLREDEQSSLEEINLNRLTGRAVHLLCWLKRYQETLFAKWRFPQISAFFYLGGCQNANEAAFCRMLSRLPVDVVLLVPDLNRTCCLRDTRLYESRRPASMVLETYPQANAETRLGTTAYYAERELDTLLYQDTGMYRDQQYTQAMAVSLRTTAEEISILWDEELRFRPNFSTEGGVVQMPVLFAKVSGVKNGAVSPYWNAIQSLVTSETLVVSQLPLYQPDPANVTATAANPAANAAVTRAATTNPAANAAALRQHVASFLRQGRLQPAKIKADPGYAYGFLREAVQDHLLNKLQLLLDQKLINGTFQNGTEYKIVATALTLNMPLLRMVQKFDFTKKNPKLVFVLTGETMLSLEDSICAAYLHLIGFDIVFFVPTGYQCIERYLKPGLVAEHQNGEYLYDLHVPTFRPGTASSRSTLGSLRNSLPHSLRSLSEKLFRR